MPQQVPVQPPLVVDEHMHANPCVVTMNLSWNAVVLISFVSVMVTTFVARNIRDVYLNDVANAKVHVKGF